MKKILVTAVGPSMLTLLKERSLPTFNKYAENNGYEVRVVELPEDDTTRNSYEQKKARWQKIAALRGALEVSDVAVWFDADIMICRFDDDIARYLGPQDYQGMVIHEVPAEDRTNPNTGVWVMRNTEKAFRFLDAVESVGIHDGRWADQGAVMRVLDWVLGEGGEYRGAHMPETHNEFMEGTVWLPIGWNQRYCENRPNPGAYIGIPLVKDPYAVHFTNMSVDERMRYMADFLPK